MSRSSPQNDASAGGFLGSVQNLEPDSLFRPQNVARVLLPGAQRHPVELTSGRQVHLQQRKPVTGNEAEISPEMSSAAQGGGIWHAHSSVEHTLFFLDNRWSHVAHSSKMDKSQKSPMNTKSPPKAITVSSLSTMLASHEALLAYLVISYAASSEVGSLPAAARRSKVSSLGEDVKALRVGIS